MGESIQFTEIIFGALIMGPWLMALSSGGHGADTIIYSGIVLVSTIAVVAAVLVVANWIFGHGYLPAILAFVALIAINLWMFAKISE